MKSAISTFVCSALLGAGLATVAMTGTAQAQTAGAFAVPLNAPVSNEATVKAEPVNHRHWRRYNRRHSGGGGVYFNFGNGSFSLTVPPQRYHRRYQRHYNYSRSAGSLHVRWCYDRYRSYRHWDNTFQPYHGPRRQCVSPYY